VEQLDDVFRPAHELVVDVVTHHDAAHRDGARRDALGERDHVRHHAKALGSEGVAETAEPGDHLVEDQQDAMLVAQLAQPLEVALRRRQHAGRTGHRLNDNGGDGGGIMQRHHALKLVGQVHAPFGLTLGVGLLSAVVGVRQVISARQQRAKPLAVGDHAAHRNAAEAHTMITALTADHAGARGFTARTVIGERHLQGGVAGFRAGVGEERIVQVTRRQHGKARGQFENLRVAVLEGRREIELGSLLLDGVDDRLAAMTGIGAPQAGGRINQRAALHVVVVHVLGASDQTRPLLERCVGRKAHEEGFQVVRGRFPGSHIEMSRLVHRSQVSAKRGHLRKQD
jgi:hypothetical protein